jgi:hypothetical protein
LGSDARLGVARLVGAHRRRRKVGSAEELTRTSCAGRSTGTLVRADAADRRRDGVVFEPVSRADRGFERIRPAALKGLQGRSYSRSMRPPAVPMSCTIVGDVHASFWSAPADEDHVVALERELEALADQRSRAIGVLLVVAEGTPLSTAAARARAAQMIRRLGSRIGAIAIVIEGTGFAAAAVRAMFTGIALAVPSKVSWAVFANAASGLPWISKRLAARNGCEIEPLPVLAALERMRAHAPSAVADRPPSSSRTGSMTAAKSREPRALFEGEQSADRHGSRQ